MENKDVNVIRLIGKLFFIKS